MMIDIKRTLTLSSVVLLAAWTPSVNKQEQWQGFRAPYTEQAAVGFLRTSFEEAARLSFNAGAKKDPVACAQCMVSIGRSFLNLLSAVFEDQRIEDERVAKERNQMYRGYPFDFDIAWQERLEEMTETCSRYLESAQGQQHLEKLLNELSEQRL